MPRKPIETLSVDKESLFPLSVFNECFQLLEPQY